MSETIVKRNGNKESRLQANKNLSRAGVLKSNYANSKSAVERLEESLEIEKAKQKRVAIALDETREQLLQAQEEIDSDYLPEGAQPKSRVQLRDRLELQLAQLDAALSAQKKSTEVAFQNVTIAERKLFEADRDMSKFIDTLEDTNTQVKAQMELDKERSSRLARLESQRASIWENEQKMAIDARMDQMNELTELATQQIKSAKQGHISTIKRVIDASANTKVTVDKLKATQETFMEDRTQAVLELKTNVGVVRAELATNSNNQARKAREAQQQLEDEKDSLLAKGLNPYVVFRKRELAAEGQAREARMKNAVEQNKSELAERLIHEEEAMRNVDLAVRKAKSYEKKHRDEQGRHVIEKRNSKYITSIVSGAGEVLDPSGRAARVDPSQVTDIADFSFGLGKSSRISADSMERITEKIRNKLNVDKDDLGEYKRLIKAQIQSVEQLGGQHHKHQQSGTHTDAANMGDMENMTQELDRQADELRGYAVQDGRVPGADTSALEVNINSDDVIKTKLLRLVEEEVGGSVTAADDVHDHSTPKYKTATLSKFEVDSLAKARERQKDRLESGVPQIAGGKLFQGQSFVSKPAELLFKDFEIGNTYKKHFSMTNASYTFNAFKLLDIEDEFIDFFTITYEKPGRMSAGVSCSLQIVFSPQINQDISTNIRFLTETGPVSVPLKCRIKRCAPKITNGLVDFGGIVMGQKLCLPLKIVNSQAISSGFTITRIGDQHGVGMRKSSSMRSTSFINAEATPDADLGGPEQEDDQDDSVDFIGSTPAVNAAELQARVTRITTQLLRRKQRDDPFPLSVVKSEGNIAGYSNTTVDVQCAPLIVGSITQDFSVLFHGIDTKVLGTVDEHGEPITKEQLFSVRVTGEDVPVYLTDDVVDMRCTLFGRIYRKRLELHNRAKSAYRVNIKINSPLSKYVEVNPAMLFVQSMDSQCVNIKFTPTEEILSDFAHFTVLYEEFFNAAAVSIPIEIQAVNQELPVYFVLKSNVCPSTLELSTSAIDFGHIYVNQQSSVALAVKNLSMLPQKIAFVRLKKEITVQPNEGFATLLPNESLQFEVFFTPSSAGAFDLELCLMTSFNDSYMIKVTASGIEAPIELSSAVIKMNTTSPGERILQSTTVRNKSQSLQNIEIVVPESKYTWLRISPTVLSLAPGEAARVEIEFSPPANAKELNPLEWHKQLQGDGSAAAFIADESPYTEWEERAGWVFARGMFGELQWVQSGAGTKGPCLDQVGGGGSEDVSSQGGDEGSVSVIDTALVDKAMKDLPYDLPDDEWGICGKWSLPVFIRQKSRQGHKKSQSGTTIGAMNSTSAGDTDGHNYNTPMMILKIETAVTLPQIDASTKILDFGQMAVGTRLVRTFRVFNKSNVPVHLGAKGYINAVGPFTMQNQVDTIEPGSSKAVIIECIPSSPGLFVEILELACGEIVGGHRLRITLRAHGVKPSIELSGLLPPPANWSPRCGLLDFNNVVAGDFSVMKFTVLNKSTFSVNAVIDRAVSSGLPLYQQAELIDRTAGGSPIISFKPEKAIIPAGGSQIIEVTFRPDRERFEPYREELDISVGASDETVRVGVFGRSWSRQMIVLPSNPLDEPFAQPNIASAFPVEDVVLNHTNYDVRKTALDVTKSLGFRLPTAPPIKLEYPDPFVEDADPATYTVIEAGAATAKGGSKTAAPTGPAGARCQARKLTVCCVRIADGRPGAANGTYEVNLSAAAKESGLFSVTAPDKGPVTMGSVVTVEIICTLPKPKGIGGLAVGSWQLFSAEVIVKGGWIPMGEADERRIPFLLRAFVSL